MIEISVQILNEWFNKFNREYFENQINFNFPIKIINKKVKYLGACTINNFDKMVKSIQINVFYQRNTLDYQNTLIHEMIHAYTQQVYGVCQHDYLFKRKAREIYNKSNGLYDITTKCNCSFEVSSINANINKSYYIVIYKKQYSNDLRIARISKNNIQQNLTSLQTYYNCTIVNHGYISDMNVVIKFSQGRTYIKGYLISNEFYINNILNNPKFKSCMR